MRLLTRIIALTMLIFSGAAVLPAYFKARYIFPNAKTDLPSLNGTTPEEYCKKSDYTKLGPCPITLLATTSIFIIGTVFWVSFAVFVVLHCYCYQFSGLNLNSTWFNIIDITCGLLILIAGMLSLTFASQCYNLFPCERACPNEEVMHGRKLSKQEKAMCKSIEGVCVESRTAQMRPSYFLFGGITSVIASIAFLITGVLLNRRRRNLISSQSLLTFGVIQNAAYETTPHSSQHQPVIANSSEALPEP
ncbi:hypothetical protein Ocin01_04727 [Orchesella cincta]|uniref:Uncharacterized protein n=1 Tax=Orchesella cincta TaxID=48709 RepID=A0A1D2N9N5_ORCCI|nr:hypothetical protein Ocin01_04727 [Orchesella cincta]